MKALRILTTSALLLMCSSAAFAGHYYGHGRYSGPRVGIYINPFPVTHYHHYYRGSYYYPYYYPGVVLAPEIVAAPTVIYSTPAYVETPVVTTYPSYTVSPPVSTPAQPVNTGNDWLYCSQPDGFYPAIKDCPGGWRHVPAQPR